MGDHYESVGIGVCSFSTIKKNLALGANVRIVFRLVISGQTSGIQTPTLSVKKMIALTKTNFMISFEERVLKAVADPVKRGELLMDYRPFLKILAWEQLYRKNLQSKLDDSDIVQEVLLRADGNFESFRGKGEPEFTGWIRQIFNNYLVDLLRKHHGHKRNVRLEQSLFSHQSESAVLWLGEPTDHQQNSPSAPVMLGEQALILAAAIDSLAKSQAEAIRLRYFAELPIKDVAEKMNTSIATVAGLLRRGVDGLRERLPGEMSEILS